VGREKPDFYALKAQKEGYPARSVYKLEEIHQKLSVLKKGARILDVGSSPGSWSLYALKFLKGSGFVVGVDLNPVTLKVFPPNSFFFQGDIFEPKTEAILGERGPYDVILSDAAPLTTGNRLVDTGRSFRLCERVLELASSSMLTHQGTLVMKVFQGGDEKQLADRMRETFTQVKTLRPQAVRRESFETYLIGLGKRRPGD
jgi:23S rRNA (uridine2552-2'-O)-methyltransferase